MNTSMNGGSSMHHDASVANGITEDRHVTSSCVHPSHHVDDIMSRAASLLHSIPACMSMTQTHQHAHARTSLHVFPFVSTGSCVRHEKTAGSMCAARLCVCVCAPRVVCALVCDCAVHVHVHVQFAGSCVCALHACVHVSVHVAWCVCGVVWCGWCGVMCDLMPITCI